MDTGDELTEDEIAELRDLARQGLNRGTGVIVVDASRVLRMLEEIERLREHETPAEKAALDAAAKDPAEVLADARKRTK